MIGNALLLKSAAQNIPIFNYYDIPVKPLAIVVKNRDEIPFIAKKFSCQSMIVNTSTSLEHVKGMISYKNMGFSFIVPQSIDGKMPRSVKQMEKFDLILNTVINSKKMNAVNAVVIFVFEGKIPKIYKHKLTQIMLSDIDNPLLNKDLVPKTEQISLAFDKFEDISDKVKGYEWVYLSAAFLYPVLLNIGRKSEYPKIVAAAHDMVKEMEAFKNSDSIVEMVLNSLVDYITNTANKVKLVRRVSYSEKELEKFVCIRRNFLYMTSEQFDSILNQFDNIVQINELKEMLSNRGILLGDSASGYSLRMNYTDSCGNSYRPHRYKIDMQCISAEDGRTLYDAIKENDLIPKGGVSYESLYYR